MKKYQYDHQENNVYGMIIAVSTLINRGIDVLLKQQWICGWLEKGLGI